MVAHEKLPLQLETGAEQIIEQWLTAHGEKKIKNALFYLWFWSGTPQRPANIPETWQETHEVLDDLYKAIYPALGRPAERLNQFEQDTRSIYNGENTLPGAIRCVAAAAYFDHKAVTVEDAEWKEQKAKYLNLNPEERLLSERIYQFIKPEPDSRPTG